MKNGVFTFRFRPPETSFRVTVTQQKVFEGEGLRRIDLRESDTKVDIRGTRDGFRMTFAPLGVRRNGMKVEDPVADILSLTPLTWDLSRRGQIRRILGFEGIVERLRAGSPEHAHSLIEALYSEDALVQRQVNDWQARVGQFIGRRSRIGDAWLENAELPGLVATPIHFRVATRLAEFVPSGQAKCVRIRFGYGSSSADILRDAWTKVAASPRMDEDGTKLRGEGDRLLDPETGLIHAERASRVISSTLVMGDQRTEVTMRESLKYDYYYVGA